MAIASAFRNLAELAAKKAPYEDALALAQRHAALPVSEGGLGLPAGNTAMDRARAMGYDTTVYHGRSRSAASRGDFTDVLPGAGGTEAGALWAGDKALAGKYTGRQGAVYPLMTSRSSLAETGYAMPSESEIASMSPAQVNRLLSDVDAWNEKINAVKPEYVASEIEKATREGKNGAVFRQFLDVPLYSTSADFPSDVYALQKGVRSRFAAFDPFRRNESDLLAGIAPYALPAAGAAGLAAMAAPGEAEASPYSALSDLYKSVGKKLPWTERELMAGLPKGRTIAPQDLALEAARREAEAMGLPASNTAADRAALIGLDEPMYHGTKSDFDAFQLDKSHPGLSVNAVSLSNDPQHASHYATLAGRSGGNVLPVVSDMGRTGQLFDLQDARGSAAASGLTSAQELEAKGIDSIRMDGGAVNYILDPSRIRSRFAAMNPALKDSSNLLAGLGGAAVGAGALMAPSDSEAGIASILAKTAAGREASAYAEMMDLKRAANARSRTHGPRASMTPGAEAVRAMAIEAMNPASWPLLWGSRELGDPQARDYSNQYHSYSGSRR